MALIGAIVLIGLTSTFISNVEHDPRISADVSAQVGVAAGSNTNFVSSAQIDAAAKRAGLDATTTAALVDDYESAQLRSLKAGSWLQPSSPSSRSGSRESCRTSDRLPDQS